MADDTAALLDFEARSLALRSAATTMSKQQPAMQCRPQLSIVIPAFDEQDNVVAIAARIADILGSREQWELVFIDDGSRDGTLDAIRALAAQDPRVRFVSFTRNFGQQAALRAGLRHALGAAVILMDCDLEHPPELLPELLAAWRGGAKVVSAQRRSDPKRSTFFKRVSSNLFYRLLDSIGDVRIETGSADFVLLDRVVVDAINRFDNSDVFLRGLVRWLGYPQVKIPYSQGVRETGESKFTTRRMVEFAITGIVTHSLRPLRIAIYVSAIFAFFGVLLFVYSIVGFLWIPRTVVGWSSIMSAIAILGAGQFFMLGIIGEYIGGILREARRWPSYIVEENEASMPFSAAEAPDPAASGGDEAVAL